MKKFISRFIDLPFMIEASQVKCLGAGQPVPVVKGVGGIFQVAYLKGAPLPSGPAI